MGGEGGFAHLKKTRNTAHKIYPFFRPISLSQHVTLRENGNHSRVQSDNAHSIAPKYFKTEDLDNPVEYIHISKFNVISFYI